MNQKKNGEKLCYPNLRKFSKPLFIFVCLLLGSLLVLGKENFICQYMECLGVA